MNEDSAFFQKAAEAIMVTSLNAEKVDPTIRELLNRVKYVSTPINQNNQQFGQSNSNQIHEQINLASQRNNSNIGPNDGSGVIAPENKTILNYFDKLLSNPVQTSDSFANSSTTTALNSLIASTQQINYSSDSESRQKKRKIHSKRPQQGPNSVQISDSGDDSEDKRFPCEKCHMVFRRSSDLRRHERQHLPILPNICTLCGKGFARKDALKRHYDTQTCKRNRQKLLSIGGDINEILERARQSGATIYSGNK